MAYAANLGRGDIVYPGLIAAWSAKGKSNDDEDRAILKDLTGNGHDISLNGFAFSEMSGYGGYNVNFLNFNTYSEAVIEKTDAKITIYNTNEKKTNIWKYISGANAGTIVNYKSYKIKVSGLNEDEFIHYKYSIGDDFKNINTLYIKNGVTEIPEIYGTVVTDKIPYTTLFEYQVALKINKKITIEQIPNYEDALVFDGVDDYGIINKDNPVLKDFTIITKRIYQNGNITGCLLSKYKHGNSCFSFESNGNNFGVFGSGNQIIYSENEIVYGTTKSYNGERSLIKGNDIDANYVQIKLGTFDDVRFSNFAFYSAYLFDRSLDEQEIKSFIRKYIDPEYLLPSEIPTPDCYYDFSQGSNDDETRETITDLSGNGNNAVAHNFAWNGGMSGYGGYPFVWTEFTQESGNLVYDKNKVTIKNNSIPLSNAFLFKTGFTGTNFKIKVTNKPDDITLQIGSSDAGKQELFNGENTITLTFSNMPIGLFVTPCTGQNIIIEIVPKYPGALVFDGVDDYVSLDAFDSGFKTVFMVCKPLALDSTLYDQRVNTGSLNYAVFNLKSSVAYNSRNINDTYINNNLNNTINVEELLNKKHLININTDTIENNIPILGSTIQHNSLYANMALYKFLGFKEALTEEQINAIIKKYNLLDGVDEIEVS